MIWGKLTELDQKLKKKPVSEAGGWVDASNQGKRSSLSEVYHKSE